MKGTTTWYSRVHSRGSPLLAQPSRAVPGDGHDNESLRVDLSLSLNLCRTKICLRALVLIALKWCVSISPLIPPRLPKHHAVSPSADHQLAYPSNYPSVVRSVLPP